MLLALSIPSATGASDWWRPEGRISWDWQLTEPIDLDRDVAMFDLDLFDTEAGSVRQICDTLDCADVGREAALGFSLQAAFVTGRYGRRKGAP